MSRAVPEWIGATDDTPIPPRVKLRVFEKHAGRCYLSGRKIMPGDAWECDHVLAIINGGQNRESNLAPALKAKHRVKSDDDMAIKSKTARIRAAHLGIKPTSKRKIPSRPFAPTRDWRQADG
jgi:5-methylcytosine-specific restriction protein A